MKKILYAIGGSIIFLLFACQKFDDIALWNMANSQEERLTALEDLCGQINTNIDALRALVTASQTGDYIMNVAPVTKDGEEIGYTITFAQNGTVTIYHGKDGKDGNAGDNSGNGDFAMPSVGLKKDTDGIHYWTLNGEWLLDEASKKVKASGNDGKNGQTPQLKIENGHWMLSMDDGTTWKDLGKATGENGNGGDGIFEKVDYTTNDDCVVFTLANGGEFRLPKYGNGGSLGALSITFSETTDILVEPLVDYDITYNITGADANTTIEATGMDGFKTVVNASSKSRGTITVTPAWKNVDKSVVVMVTDGKGRTTIKRLTFRYDDEYSYITFPDAKLRYDLLLKYDTDYNCEISYSEARDITEIIYDTENSHQIYSLEGIQYCTNLRRLKCREQDIKTLNIYNSSLREIEIYTNKDLYSANISNCTSLTKVTLYACSLFSLNINNCCNLDTLDCSANKFISLNVSEYTALIYLRCSANNLTSLDVSKNTALMSLNCSLNYLTALDVSKNTALTTLRCQGNKLTSLDVSNTALTTLDCSSNNLSATALNKIFNDLPQRTSKSTIDIRSNPGSNTCNTSIAKNKGWTVVNQ